MRLNTPGRTRARESGIEQAVLPLINVVLLLLVFFLMAGRLGQGKEAAQSPESWLSSRKAEAAPKLVRLRPSGEIDADGVRVLDDGLQAEAARWGAVAVDVQTDASVPAPRVLHVLNQLYAAGVGEVRLLTVSPR